MPDVSLCVTSDTVQKIDLYVDEIASVLQCRNTPQVQFRQSWRNNIILAFDNTKFWGDVQSEIFGQYLNVQNRTRKQIAVK